MNKGSKSKVTKFPVARIKRIMQKDDDVGKVAQATPVVISKALELFLELVVKEASDVTTSRGARRVEAYHLKHAINTTDTFDFLKELVEAVPDPSAGGTLPESGTANTLVGDDSGGEGVGVPARRKRVRRKPAGDDDDAEPVAVQPKRPRAPRKKKGEGEDGAAPAPRRRGKKAEAAAALAQVPGEMSMGEADEDGEPAEGHERPPPAMDEDYEDEDAWPPARGQGAQW